MEKGWFDALDKREQLFAAVVALGMLYNVSGGSLIAAVVAAIT